MSGPIETELKNRMRILEQDIPPEQIILLSLTFLAAQMDRLEEKINILISDAGGLLHLGAVDAERKENSQ
jgi:hypothetical protein